MAEKSAKDRLLDRLNPKVTLREVLDTLADKIIPQGAAELAQAINSPGNSFVVYGSGQEPLEPVADVEGAGPKGVPEINAMEVQPESAREAADHIQASQWFEKAASSERQNSPLYTPAQKETRLDQFQGMAQATRDSHAEKGTVPPMWSVLNREEMRAAFSPEPQLASRAASPDISGQSAKDRFLASNPPAQAGYKVAEVSDIGRPQSAMRQAQIDPLDKAREAAREASLGRSKSRGMEVG